MIAARATDSLSGRLAPAALAALVLAGLVSHPAQAGRDADVLRRAQAASAKVAFVGRVVVRWLDGEGVEHDEYMNVKGKGSQLELSSGVNQPALTWSGGVGPTRTAPDPTDKYDVRAEPGPLVLGRPTTRVVLELDGLITEEADVDDASGLLLRRQVFDERGWAVRVVEFTSLEDVRDATTTAVKGGAWKAPRVDDVPQPFQAPERLASGYARLGTYRRGPALQVLYGDGVRTLSVFTQLGHADPSALPAGGEHLEVGGTLGRRWTWAGGQVVTWSARGATTIVVGDGPPEEVLAAARSVPAPASSTFLFRLRHKARHVVSLFA
jgi:hypothetical protein